MLQLYLISRELVRSVVFGLAVGGIVGLVVAVVIILGLQ
jgi:hypothetical protein